MQQGPGQMPESVNLQYQMTLMHIEEWLKDDVFHLRWWLLIGMVLASLMAWYFLLDKTRSKSVCLFAAIETILVLGVAEYGEELLLWDYPTDIIAIFPPLTSINLLIIPLAFSLLFQFVRTKRRFIYAAILLSAAISFVIEPLLSWGDFYQLIKWRFSYSFPVYLLMALISRYLTNKLDEITAKNKAQPGSLQGDS
jgi:hypothetical protein